MDGVCDHADKQAAHGVGSLAFTTRVVRNAFSSSPKSLRIEGVVRRSEA